MLRIQNILVPVDFSERSVAAAKHAVALAQRFDAALAFIHVVPPLPAEYAGFDGGYYVGRLHETEEARFVERTQQLDCFARRISPDREAARILAHGDPAHEIVGAAGTRRADLIIMPTHGYGPFRRFILGSVTAKVLHDIDCPVMTGAHMVPLAVEEVRPHHRVACAVDFQPHSEKVLRWAAEFAAAYHAALLLIHATPPVEAGWGSEVYAGAEWRRGMINWAQEQAAQLIEKIGCRAEALIEPGAATKYVPRAVAEAGADVLVIGRSVRDDLLGRLRTNAYALIRESPVPVVSV